jgi:hypothetical protein
MTLFWLFKSRASMINLYSRVMRVFTAVESGTFTAGKGYVMRTHTLLLSLMVLSLLLPAAVSAQGKTANIVGYEKAQFVTGLVSVNAAGDSVALVGLRSVYDRPLDLYLARSFDQSEAFKVGEIAAGKTGDVFFDVPALDVAQFDTILLMVPGWSVPVGVGLLQ